MGGGYNGQCTAKECKSKKRDYSTGNCLECGASRASELKVFKIQMAASHRVTRPRIQLQTGKANSNQDWEIRYRRGRTDEEHAYIQLIHLPGDDDSDEKQHESLEYKIDATQVDIERRCTEFKTFNDFFSRGMARGRRPNLDSYGYCGCPMGEWLTSNPSADAEQIKTAARELAMNCDACRMTGDTFIDAATGRAPLISCADSRVMIFPTVDAATEFWVKENPFSLKVFLGAGREPNAEKECPVCLGVGHYNPKADHKAMRSNISQQKIDAWKTHLNRENKCTTCNGDGKIDYEQEALVLVKRLLDQRNKASMVIFRLAPQDYHRFHYAVTGTIVDHYAIHGKLFSVNPSAINAEKYRVFQENQRYVTVIRTDNGKYVYAIPVGAAMVGSIVFHNADGTSTVEKGKRVNAGDLHGKMRFGGSTVVYLFEDGTAVYDKDLLARSGMKGNWTEKIPCPSITCTLSEIWEKLRNYEFSTLRSAEALQAKLVAEAIDHPCRKCNSKGWVSGKDWPIMETYFQAGERLGTTTIQCA